MGRTVHFTEGIYHFSGSHVLLMLCTSLHLCSQILTNPNHHFVDSSLYKDVILVAWDPAPYSANLNVVRCLLGLFFPISLKALEKMNVFSTAVSWFSLATMNPKVCRYLRSGECYMCMSWSKLVYWSKAF